MNENKSRLAEILGVEEGEEWEISNAKGTKCRIHEGKLETRVNDYGWFVPGSWALKLCKLINHPETIIRDPRLTEPELAICKAIGALWLSLDSNEDFVKAWMDKPGIEGAGDGSWIRFNNGGNLYSFIAKIRKDLFPSVHPGDLIEVP